MLWQSGAINLWLYPLLFERRRGTKSKVESPVSRRASHPVPERQLPTLASFFPMETQTMTLYQPRPSNLVKWGERNLPDVYISRLLAASSSRPHLALLHSFSLHPFSLHPFSAHPSSLRSNPKRVHHDHQPCLSGSAGYVCFR